jgi:phosphoribosylglycinamide formyltransferase-1
VIKKKVGVLISGNGSNLQALIDASRQPGYPAEIVVVISNKADAFGLVRAKNAGVSAHVVNHKDYASRVAFDESVHTILQQHGVELVCLAGFMRLLGPQFVDRWRDRLLNIHPSLLPDFKGAHAVADALKAGAKKSGCTVHLVVAEVDAGPIILQAEVPVLVDDTEDALHQRIHKQEYKLYPQALKLLIERAKTDLTD